MEGLDLRVKDGVQVRVFREAVSSDDASCFKSPGVLTFSEWVDRGPIIRRTMLPYGLQHTQYKEAHFELPRHCFIQRVIIEEYGSVILFPNSIRDELVVQMYGTGSVEFRSLTLPRLYVHMNGDTKLFGNVRATAAEIDVTGRGIVSGVHAVAAIEARIFGQGNIQATAEKNTTVYERALGGGNIVITRQDE